MFGGLSLGGELGQTASCFSLTLVPAFGPQYFGISRVRHPCLSNACDSTLRTFSLPQNKQCSHLLIWSRASDHQAIQIRADGASTSQPANHANSAAGDLFGGLETAQPPHSSTVGNGDMFGGLSLGSSSQDASCARPTGQPKQAQPAAALDADLFGGSLNGQSAPMGIPQQVMDC
jgi:hypothetical protein